MKKPMMKKPLYVPFLPLYKFICVWSSSPRVVEDIYIFTLFTLFIY